MPFLYKSLVFWGSIIVCKKNFFLGGGGALQVKYTDSIKHLGVKLDTRHS